MLGVRTGHLYVESKEYLQQLMKSWGIGGLGSINRHEKGVTILGLRKLLFVSAVERGNVGSV